MSQILTQFLKKYERNVHFILIKKILDAGQNRAEFTPDPVLPHKQRGLLAG